MRIFELAQETGVPSKVLIDTLGKMGYPVKSHSSTIENHLADRLRKQTKDLGYKPKKPKKAKAKPEAAIPAKKASDVTPSKSKTTRIRDDHTIYLSGVSPQTARAEKNKIIASGVRPPRSGTSRMDQPIISSGVSPSPPTSQPQIISAGMSKVPYSEITLNDEKYFLISTLSKSTGEAEIHLVEKDSTQYVFKLYYPNFKPKDSLLAQLKGLRHDDIIELIDYGYYGDRFFEIMGYAAGGSLLDKNEDGSYKYIPIKDVTGIKQIVKETVNALYYCHQKGIIHKDIKPGNIFFRNSDGTDILIGDFGISSVLDEGMSRRLTSQSLTVGYAAPEQYGIGGKVYVGKEVDYYSLGLTIIHLWLGRNLFEDENGNPFTIHQISTLTISGFIDIPKDMPVEVNNLVKGLITHDYTKRWGHEQVQGWLRGERVPVFYKPGKAQYNEFNFGLIEGLVANDPIELASLLEKYPDHGKRHLYKGTIQKWLIDVDQSIYLDIRNIVEDEHPDDEDAGLIRAIYVLDKERPFKSSSGIECSTTEEIADALEKEANHYKTIFASQFKKYNNDFFQFLKARGETETVDKLKDFVNLYDPEVALNNIIFFLNPERPYKLLPNIEANSPVELARQIYGKNEGWKDNKIPQTYQEGIRQLINESIIAWLKRRGHDDIINEWSIIKDTYGTNKEAVLESFLRIMDPTLPKISLSIIVDSKISDGKGKDRKWIVKKGSEDTATIKYKVNGCGVPLVSVKLDKKTPGLELANKINEIIERSGSIELMFDTNADNIPVNRNLSNHFILTSELVELSTEEIPIRYKVGFPLINTAGIFLLYGMLFSLGAFGLRGIITKAGFGDWLYNYYGLFMPYSKLIEVNIQTWQLYFLGDSKMAFFVVPFLLVMLPIIFWLYKLIKD